MAKTLVFKSNDVSNFVGWLKKFSSIETSLLLEINETKQEFIAKSYNSEKSVVKYSKISFSEAGLEVTSKLSDNFIKLGIFNISQLIKSLDQFRGGEFTITIKYDEVNNEWGGLSILIKDDRLKIKVDCTSLNIFKYISDELFKDVIMQTEEVSSFNFPVNNIEEILSLSNLDKEYKFLEFIIKNGNVYINGKTFELQIDSVLVNKQHVLSLYKEQFDKVDKENYDVTFGDDKLVFNSLDTNTITVLSMVVKDEKYEEIVSEFE